MYDGAQRADTEGALAPRLHQRPDEDHESSLFQKMRKDAPVAFTQRFKFLERFTKTVPSPPLGCTKLILTEKSASGNRIQMICEMLTVFIRICSCSNSNQLTVTVVPGADQEKQ